MNKKNITEGKDGLSRPSPFSHPDKGNAGKRRTKEYPFPDKEIPRNTQRFLKRTQKTLQDQGGHRRQDQPGPFHHASAVQFPAVGATPKAFRLSDPARSAGHDQSPIQLNQWVRKNIFSSARKTFEFPRMGRRMVLIWKETS